MVIERRDTSPDTDVVIGARRSPARHLRLLG
jgi:hypothetical protein